MMDEPISVMNANMSIINKRADKAEKEQKEQLRQSKLKRAKEKYGQTS